MSRQTYKLLVDYIQNNQDKFYRLAYSYCKSREDALDIVQDAIYKGLKSHKHIRTDYIESWFYRILINTSISFFEKKKYLIPFDSDMEQGREDKRISRLISCHRYFKTEDKTLIILRFFEDRKLSNIAEILDLNVNTVKTRLYKSLKLLKLELDLEVNNE